MNVVLDLLLRLPRLVARAWPRRLIIRASGEPVELVHIAEDQRGQWVLIEHGDGRRTELPLAALGSRPVLSQGRIAMTIAFLLAGVLAVLSGLGLQERSKGPDPDEAADRSR